ncbi:MAG: oligogalacturonate lyase [Acidobacteriota bacterium]|nr:oligogalacturonate lyase [Acidobacteriota bacterium]
MPSFRLPILAAVLTASLAGTTMLAQSASLPTTWVDQDTGHRVYRLTSEPGSSAFYFNINAYSPDGKLMVYNAPDGIHTLDLATRKTRLLVANPPRPENAQPGTPAYFRNAVHTVVVGHKSNSVFYTQNDPATHVSVVYKADLITGAITRLVALPPRATIATVNADETLAAGTYMENAADADREFGRNAPVTPADHAAAVNSTRPPTQPGFLVQAENKGQMMEARLAARIPLVLFTINLQTGKITELLHSTDWVNHLLFSPSDPTLLMYCHEGPWQKVDRIWMIHTDGTHNTLIHKRTMQMEIAGHEFWGLDGQTIWYDWQYPKGEDFFLAGYDLATGKRTAYHMQRNEWSIHFNLTQDLDLFTGDGGDPGQVAKAPDGEWIELFHPEPIKGTTGALNSPDFWQPGVFHAEHLVNMAHHNYRLEPNVRFSPDKKLVFFTSNMFGPSYVFAVEVAKTANASDAVSTPVLAARFNPTRPTPTTTPK